MSRRRIVVFGASALLVLGVGCASTPKDPCAGCPPRVKTVTVEIPVSCIIPIPVPARVALPEWPAFPGHDATDDQVDAWLADVVAVQRKREALLMGQVDADSLLITTHNESLPLCRDVHVTQP